MDGIMLYNHVCPFLFKSQISLWNTLHISIKVSKRPTGAYLLKFRQNGEKVEMIQWISIKWKHALHSVQKQQYTYLSFLQYKILHNRFVTQTLLKEMSKTESESCLYCKEKYSQVHVLIYCPSTIQLWSNAEKWVRKERYWDLLQKD